MLRKLLVSTSLITIGLSLQSCLPTVVTAATKTGVTVAQERSFGDAIDDATINSKINSAMLQEDVNNLFVKINVKVTEGSVLLTGTVKDPDARARAAQIAWDQKGVKEVINEIKVSSESLKLSDVTDYSKDTWITTQIKSKLLLNKDVKSVNYSIDTINGVVYMTGVAQDQQELNTVTQLVGSVSYVKKVVNYVRIKGSKLREHNHIYK